MKSSGGYKNKHKIQSESSDSNPRESEALVVATEVLLVEVWGSEDWGSGDWSSSSSLSSLHLAVLKVGG